MKRQFIKKRKQLVTLLCFISLLSANKVFSVNDSNKLLYSRNLLNQQQKNFLLKGKVTDDNGEVLPGASIFIKGTTNGVTTDINGSFRLEVTAGDILVFSYIGMKTKEVTITTQQTLNVDLYPDAIGLDEVVAIGYSSKKKKDLIGAVEVVKMSDIKSTPVAGVDQMMQGRMAGVNVIGDNMPGGGVAVRVRGFSTIRNNDPLYIVDGVPVESGINLINPNDIESIQVLKDASSASIYGSRATNGVVIITTKKGKKGIHFNLDAYYGLQTVANKNKTLGAKEYGDLLWEAHKNDGKNAVNDVYGSGDIAKIPEYLDKNKKVPAANVDWVDEISQIAPVQSYNVSILRGDEKGKQAFSIAYFNQEGTIKYTKFERVSSRLNSDYKLFGKLKVGENLSVSHSWSKETETNSVLGSVIYDAYKYPSIVPVKDLDGNFAGAFLNDIRNPLAKLYYNKDNVKKRLKIFGNIYASFEIIKGLTLKSDFGIDFNNYYFRNFSPKYQETGATNPITKSSLFNTNSQKFNWVWSNTVRYDFNLEKSNFNIFAGMETIKSIYEFFSASREGFAYEDKNFRYLDAGDGGNQKNSGNGFESSLLSYFGKIDYNYNNRFLAAFTIRRDGSSKLGNNKWSNFPAFSFGWRISEEDFFSFDNISSLKLRFGWGQNGNQDVPSYATIESYYSNSYYSNYAIDGEQDKVYTGFSLSRNGNPDLKWETSTQTNIGIDLGFLENRITATIDYFIKDTKDLLLERPLPPVAGGTNGTVWDNVGKMRNQGLEFVLSYSNSNTNTFKWGADFNLAYIKNKLIELPNDVPFITLPDSYLHSVNFDQETSRSEVGQPISSFYGYRSLGLFNNQQEIDSHGIQPNAKPGDIKFEDVNKDGVLDDKDRDYIGSPHPDFTIGLNLNFEYKNFDFQMFFNSSIGNEVWDLTRYYGDFYNLSTYNKFERITNAWREDNKKTKVPRLSLDDPNNNIRPSSYYISDASFVRLKNLTIGYNFNNIFNTIENSKLRVYFQIQNLFTITRYKGLDPEVGLQNYNSEHRNLDIGVDRGLYPPSRTFTFGVSALF